VDAGFKAIAGNVGKSESYRATCKILKRKLRFSRDADYGPGGEQSMLVMVEGRNPGTAQLQALGKQHGIKNAPEILAKVKNAVANWPRFAEQADVSRKSAKVIVDQIKLQ
jgi:hypothetical protein